MNRISNKRITNYDELVAHRKKLEADLVRQKGYINEKVGRIKDKLEPIGRVLSFFKGESNHKATSLLKIGSQVGIDLLLQRKLGKAGWLTKLILPFVLRFASAKTIDKVEEKENGVVSN